MNQTTELCCMLFRIICHSREKQTFVEEHVWFVIEASRSHLHDEVPVSQDRGSTYQSSRSVAPTNGSKTSIRCLAVPALYADSIASIDCFTALFALLGTSKTRLA